MDKILNKDEDEEVKNIITNIRENDESIKYKNSENDESIKYKNSENDESIKYKNSENDESIKYKNSENDENIKYKNTSNNSENDESIKFFWSKQHEIILSEWADKAMCYKWLHNKSYEKFYRRNAWYTIPVIIMSTITGSANFAVERITDNNIKSMVSMLIGSVNIFAGVITTIQQFLKTSELTEGHRISSISWDKFYRDIRVELARSRNERQNVKYVLKHSKQEFDRLMEISPNIPNEIISIFDKTFSGGKIKYSKKTGKQLPLNDKQKIFMDIKKPEICDILETTSNVIYKNDNINHVLNDNITDILNKEQELLIYFRQIDIFIDIFKSDKDRIPLRDEIINNLQHIIKIDIIDNYIMSKNIYNTKNYSNLV